MELINKLINNKRQYLVVILAIVVVIAGIMKPMTKVCASEEYGFSFEKTSNEKRINGEYGYDIIIMDDANLLSEGELNEVIHTMNDVAKYANVIFVSSESAKYGSGEDLAIAITSKFFGTSKTDNVVTFAINMYERDLCLYSTGNAITAMIGNAEAATITDNVYYYASDKNYKECVAEAFRESYQLLQGGNIKRPMKIISNALLALMIGFLGTFLVLVKNRSNKKKTMLKSVTEANGKIFIDSSHKLIASYTYSEFESSGSGGSSSGSGGSSSSHSSSHSSSSSSHSSGSSSSGSHRF